MVQFRRATLISGPPFSEQMGSSLDKYIHSYPSSSRFCCLNYVCMYVELRTYCTVTDTVMYVHVHIHIN